MNEAPASGTFGAILAVRHPGVVQAESGSGRSPPFSIEMETDGPVPFPQIIVWEGGRQHLFRDAAVRNEGFVYHVAVPAGLLAPGRYTIQAEGCQQADPASAGAGDWVKVFSDMVVEAPARGVVQVAAPALQVVAGVKIYFGIHKHMHQPYYRAADPSFWDDEKTMIFDQRVAAYSTSLGAAIERYEQGGLGHAGLSTSWSGSLIEQLERCEREDRCYGHYRGWLQPLRAAAQRTTKLGHPRLDFSAFGFFHPLMPLIPARDVVAQIEWHRDIIRRVFAVDAARVLFPPETAFHVRMIPALREAGVEAVVYDSIHRYRTCRGYPYGGPQEGMLPPNPAEQVNPEVGDWHQLQNVWAGSKISPGLLRPEYIGYEDVDGTVHRIVGVPAERYLGNEDARGGFGALQYPQAFGQLYDNLLQHATFDPKHPPFFLLHSDGDNYGGGADSYYRHNTENLVKWIQSDPRFELVTIRDYLKLFPPDPARVAHVEPGSWSGADNGDPQFMKWFSRYRDPYSPDLNSWAVLTALQNAVHTLEDANRASVALAEARRLMLTAETSCYWYWTGQDVWDAQVTEAANRAWHILQGEIDHLLAAGREGTGPTIFPPWILPENPGGKSWGHGGLRDADRQGVAHTFVHDLSGLARVTLMVRQGGREEGVPMADRGAYPTRTGARSTAHLYTADLPAGAGDVRYWVEAIDTRGNVSRSSLERVFLA